MKKFNEYDFVSKLFTGNDKYRPVMMKSTLTNDGYLVSTDAHALCRINADKACAEYVAVEGYPNWEPIWNGCESDFENAFFVKISDVINVYQNARVCAELEDCETCDGHGTIVCHCCDNESKCDDCGGSGEGIESKTATIGFTSEDKIDIGEAKFTFKNIDRVIVACKFIGVNTIKVLPNFNKMKAIKIVVSDDVEILLMPTMQ